MKPFQLSTIQRLSSKPEINQYVNRGSQLQLIRQNNQLSLKKKNIFKTHLKEEFETKLRSKLLIRLDLIDEQAKYNICKLIKSSQSFSKKMLESNFSLRGGGCGNSSNSKKIERTQKRAILPPNFLMELKRYIELIVNKASLALDEQQSEDIIIAIQWFNAQKEHLNTICQDPYYSASSFNLIFEQLPSILRSSIQLIKISGFLCLQILQICNDLCRIFFSFFLTNEGRFLKIEEKDNLLSIIEEFETQLEIESSNIWVTGAEFEIQMIKAVIQSSPSNSDEGKKLLITFMGELVKSALSMSPSDGLIEAMIGGATFLHAAYKIKNLKQKYEIYYFFQSLQWQIINTLKMKDVSVQRILLLISNAYKTHIEKSTDWFLQFSWVKFISFLILYRPIVYKQQYENQFGLEVSWNSLITNKSIRQFSFDKNCARVLLYQKQGNGSMTNLDQILSKLGKDSFTLFQDQLLSNLQNSEQKILIFQMENKKLEDSSDYLLQILNENIDWKELDEQQYYVDELEDLVTQLTIYIKSKSSPISTFDNQQRKLEIAYIQDNVNVIIKRIFSSLHWANKTVKKISLYLERFRIILSSVEAQENSKIFQELLQFIQDINQKQMLNIQQQCQDLQMEKVKIIKQFFSMQSMFEGKFLQQDVDNNLTQLIEGSFVDVNSFLKSLQSFKNSIIAVINLITNFKSKYSQQYQKGKKFTFNVNNAASEIVNLVIKFFCIDHLEVTKKNISLYFSSISMEDETVINKIIFFHTLEQLLIDFLDEMNEQKETLKHFNDLLKSAQKKSPQNQNLESATSSPKDSLQQVNQLLRNQQQQISEFFQACKCDEKVRFNETDIGKVQNILLLLKLNVKQLEEIQQIIQNPKQLSFIIISTNVIAQYLEELQEEPEQFKEIQEKILEILNSDQQEIPEINQKQNNDLSQVNLRQDEQDKQFINQPPIQQQKIEDVKQGEIQLQFQEQQQDSSKQTKQLENQQQQEQQDYVNDILTMIMSQEKQLSEAVKIYEDCHKIILKQLSLFQTVWNVSIQFQTDLVELSNSKSFVTMQESMKSKKAYLTEKFSLQIFNQSDLQSQTIQQQRKLNPEQFQLLLYFFDNALTYQFQHFTIEKNNENLLNKGKEIIADTIQNLKKLQENENYKVRECLIMSLLFIEAAQLEPDVVTFCQSNLLQIWANEKDDRVKSLLKNNEILGLQKKLFSHDLKTFTNKLQLEMKNRFQKMNELEQKIKLEGNMETKQRQQKLLEQLQQEFEEYLDNINDMTAKLDISIIFLKEIKKDLAVIKQKIDKLQDAVQDIGDDVRKLRGKTFQELLDIRKKKVLEMKQFKDLNSVYVSLNVQEYNPITGKPLPAISVLLKEDFLDNQGEVNEFLVKEAQSKDVLLLKGLAGSGKSRAAGKIEEFLWEMHDLKRSKWIPIYVSLPTMKEPRFNLIDQALESEYYKFDKIQIKEFSEAVKKQELKIVLILDSYDEMRQEFIESNLYLTNRFSTNLLEGNQNTSEFFKVIISTRSEILASLTSYQTRFYGKSLESLKEIELKGFNESQRQEYLEQYTHITVKKELYELYEFVKHATSEKIDLVEFSQFWKKIELILTKSLHAVNVSNQGSMLTEEEANTIINITQKEACFQNISRDQIINLKKRLFFLWSQKKYVDIIQKANISPILTTPFMMEIVVQVLPTMMQKYSDVSLIKQIFIQNFIKIQQQIQKEKLLMLFYQNKRNKMLGLASSDSKDQEKLDEETNLQKYANEKWDLLDQNKFLENFSILDELNIGKISTIFNSDDDINMIIRAFKVKSLTVFDFYLAFTEFFHHRSIQKLRELGKTINYQAFLIDLSNFSQSLALDLTIHELTQVKYDAKGQLQLNYIKTVGSGSDDWKDLYFNDFQDNGEYKKLIRSCSLLTLKGSNHSFTHKSIQEFYVATYLIQYFEEIRGTLQSKQLDEQDLYNKDEFNLSKDHFSGALFLTKEKMKQFKKFPQELIEIVKLSSCIPPKTPKYVRAASNSIFLLGFTQQYLGNQRFNNIHLSCTNLFGLSFYESNLEGSKFENVNISSCNFNKANLTNVEWRAISCNELPLLAGHTSTVTSVAYSPDSQILASGSEDITIRLWDFKAGKEPVVFIDGHTKKVTYVAFSPDGQIIGSCSEDKMIFLWDVKVGKKLAVLQGHLDKVNQIAFQPDGQILASGSSDKTIRFWNIKTGAQLALFEYKSGLIFSIAYSIDGKTLATGSTDNTISLWNVKLGSFISLKGHRDTVITIAFSPDGQIMASGGRDRNILIWDIKGQRSLALLQGHVHPVSSVAFSMDTQVLASGSVDNTIRLWDVKAQKQLAILEGHTSSVLSVAFSKDGRILASGSEDKTIRQWDFNAGKSLVLLEGHSENVLSLSFSPDCQILASSGENKTIRLWDPKAGKSLAILEGHKDNVTTIAFSPDCQFLASGSEDKTLQLWDVKTGKSIALLQGHTDGVNSVAFSPNGQILASGSIDGTIILWDVKTRKQLALLQEHTEGVNSVAFSIDGQLLATGSSDNIILIWNVAEGKSIAHLEGHQGPIILVSFSPINQLLASASSDKTIRLWDIKTSKLLHVIRSKVKCVAFSPDGQILAANNKDKIILWNVKERKQVAILAGHTNKIFSLLFSPDNDYLVSGGQDTTIRLWNIKDGKLLSLLGEPVNSSYSVAFSSNDQIIAYSSKDFTIQIWELETGKSLSLLEGHKDLIFYMVFSPNGQILASGSNDKTIRLWNIITGRQLTLLEDQTQITSLQFSHDGRMLVIIKQENKIFSFLINSNPELSEIILTQQITEQKVQLNIQQPNRKLTDRQELIVQQLQKMSTEISCSKVLGERYEFQSKGCLISGANIFTDFGMNLAPLFKERGAIDLFKI